MAQKNIIYIEDRKEDVDLVQRVVEREFENVSVISITDSELALEEIQNNVLKNYEAGLLLIDINMPKISGFDILQALKDKGSYNNLPKVIFSSSTQQTDIEKAYELNCNSYLEKPSSYKDLKHSLVTTINYWLQLNVN